MIFPFVACLAVDPITGQGLPGATGQVFAKSDTSFTAPLVAVDANGLPVELTANQNGVLPSFYVDGHTAVNWRSGDWVFPLVTSEPVPGEKGEPGTPGANGQDGRDGSNVIPTAEAVYQELESGPAAALLSATIAERVDPVRGELATAVASTNAVRTSAARADDPRLAAVVIPGNAAQISGTDSFLSTPHTADQVITDDLDIRVLVALNDWTPASTVSLLSKGDGTTGNGSFRLQIGTDGKPIFRWVTGGAWQTKAPAKSIPAADGNPIWVRVTLDVDTGASLQEVRFYCSADGVAWNLMGTTGGVATAPLNNPVAALPLKIGQFVTGTDQLAGKVYEAQLRAGISGPILAQYKATASLPYTDPLGHVWSATGSVSIISQPASSISIIPGRANNEWKQNGVSYARPITTWGGYQYVAWVHQDKYIRVSRRTIGGSDWQTFDMRNSGVNLLASMMEDDNHNVLTLIADSTGVLHLWGNMHGDWMRYGKTTAPGSYDSWTPGTMIVTQANKSGTEEGLVTYPWPFIRPTDGKLFFLYRNGASGNGVTFLNSYDTGMGTWTRVAKIADGTTGTSTYNLYPINPEFDAAGTLHLFGLWALNGSTWKEDRGDWGYIKSADGGVTWTSITGSAVTLPVTPETMPKALDTPNKVTGAGNGQGVAWDASGHPHIAVLYTPDPLGNQNVWHVWWDGTAWQSEQVTTLVASGLNFSSRPGQPAILSYAGRILVLWRHQYEGWRGKVWATDVTTRAHRTFPIADMDLREWEPAPDPDALRRGQISMLVTRTNNDGNSPQPGYSEQDWTRQPIGVLGIDIARIDQLNPAVLPVLPRDKPST